MTFHWEKLDLRLGLSYTIIAVVFLILYGSTGPVWMVAGISALLAWVIVLLGEPASWRAEIAGLALFLGFGIAASLVAHMLAAYEIPRVLGLGLFTFGAILLLRFGAYWYIVGWCLTFWYLLTPLFSLSLGLGETLEGHVIGAGGLLLYGLGKRFWHEAASPEAPGEGAGLIPFAQVIPYATTVAIVMAISVFIGGRTLESDPTIIAAAALNVISPSSDQTWEAVLLRAISVGVGVLIGFGLGLWFPTAVAEQAVFVTCSFITVATIRLSFGPAVGCFAAITAFPWGSQGYEIGNAIANEKLLAEFVGIMIAGIGITILARLARGRLR
ncbi:hypothetical protein ACFORG_16225 [Lutimaribacter marinistellae]|uniref:Fusaric acid resistance protein-like n=1 Tax=Lutimaribacter marinistellae TaxID=1820329 RepID=A0ABV7TI66_9RHOB